MHRPQPDPRRAIDLDDPRVVERILRYDDLDPAEVAELERDPRAAELLDQLRTVDRFLLAGAAESAPAAEELYAYGSGPGATSLDESRRTEVRRWLAAHPDERDWAESLDSRPPSPLFADVLEDDENKTAPVAGQPEAQETRHVTPTPTVAHARAVPFAPRRRRVPAWVAWTPLAAAALVVAMTFGGGGPRSVMAGGLPASPLVRSADEAPLLFPRGHMLPAAEGNYASSPLFEVAPRSGAASYRFELAELRPGSSAFDAGEVIWSEASPAPTAIGPALEAGSYEWRAWATIDGLEQALGSRTILVVPGSTKHTRAASATSGQDPSTIRGDVQTLHSAGLLTDARHRARALPPGDERDAYLRTPH